MAQPLSKGDAAIRCPAHNQELRITSQDKLKQPLDDFLKKHKYCPRLETYQGIEFTGYVIPPDSVH